MATEGLTITPRIIIPLREIDLSYVRAGGPGGQNVNKVASKAVLRFSVRDSPSLPEAVRARALTLLASRLTIAGELVLSSNVHRDQPRNREAVLERLRQLLVTAAVAPKRRVKTWPSHAARERRLTDKKARGHLKRERSTAGFD